MPFLEFQDSYVLVSSQLDRVVAGTKLDFFLEIIQICAGIIRHHLLRRESSGSARELSASARGMGGILSPLWWLSGGSLVAL